MVKALSKWIAGRKLREQQSILSERKHDKFNYVRGFFGVFYREIVVLGWVLPLATTYFGRGRRIQGEVFEIGFFDLKFCLNSTGELFCWVLFQV